MIMMNYATSLRLARALNNLANALRIARASIWTCWSFFCGTQRALKYPHTLIA